MTTSTETNGKAQPFDAVRERVAAHLSDIVSDMALVDKASAEGGFSEAMRVAKNVGLTEAELASWVEPTARKPKEGSLGLVLNLVHGQVAPLHAPPYRALISNALQLAVDANSEATASTAKIGSGTNERPQFGYVPNRSKPSNKLPVPLGSDAANKIVAEHDAATVGTEEHKVWAQALSCVMAESADGGLDGGISADDIAASSGDTADDVRIDRLRAFGAFKQAKTVAAGRFRSLLFLPLIEDECEVYIETSKKGIGGAWQTACDRAKAAHAKYMAECREAPKAPDATEMVNRIREDAAEYLTGKSGVAVKVEKPVTEKIANAQLAIFANARKLHDLGAIDENFRTNLDNAMGSLATLANFMDVIETIMIAAGCKDAEAERRAELAREAEADAQRKADREAAELLAKQQREAAKARQKADDEAAKKAAQEQVAASIDKDAAAEVVAKVNAPAATDDDATAIAAARARKGKAA